MDNRSFDALARRLSSATSRRNAIRAMIGGAVVAVAGAALVDGDGAAARCGANGTRCNRDAACCTGSCNWETVTRGGRRVRTGTCGLPPTATPTITPTATMEPTQTPTPSGLWGYCEADGDCQSNMLCWIPDKMCYLKNGEPCTVWYQCYGTCVAGTCASA